VQMVETEDCKGRTSFYDEVGVIRDTMQNHLMMLLSLLTMDTDPKDEEFLRRTAIVADLEALRDIKSVEAVGQYEDYIKHIEEDYEAYYSKEMPTKRSSTTPTYARIALRFKSSSPFRGIPIVFTSGKALPKRRAFLRMVMVGETDALTFNVQGELGGLDGSSVKDAAIHATSGLPEISSCPARWKRVSSRHCEAPKNAASAYQVMLSDALQGKFDSFVAIPEVLQSWRIWTPLLTLPSTSFKLIKYGPGGYGLKDSLNGPEEKEEL